MLRGVWLSTMLILFMSGQGTQYQPIRSPMGIVKLRGDPFMDLVVPACGIRAATMLDAFKTLSSTYLIRFDIELVRRRGFKDRPINVALRNAALREVINRVIQETGVKDAAWSQRPDEIGAVFVRLGGDDDPKNPLRVRVSEWSAPPGRYPEDILSKLAIHLPELETSLGLRGQGIIGSYSPVWRGCALVYTARNETVGEIIRDLGRMAHKSWTFVYDVENREKSRIVVF